MSELFKNEAILPLVMNEWSYKEALLFRDRKFAQIQRDQKAVEEHRKKELAEQKAAEVRSRIMSP